MLVTDWMSPVAVTTCVSAGVGASVSLDVGGRADARNGRPVAIDGHVRAITDGRYEDATPTHGGFRFFDAGPTVVLETTIGRSGANRSSTAATCGASFAGSSAGQFPAQAEITVAAKQSPPTNPRHA